VGCLLRQMIRHINILNRMPRVTTRPVGSPVSPSYPVAPLSAGCVREVAAPPRFGSTAADNNKNIGRTGGRHDSRARRLSFSTRGSIPGDGAVDNKPFMTL